MGNEGDRIRYEEKKLGLLLIKKFTLVLGLAFGFFKDNLTNSNAGVDG